MNTHKPAGFWIRFLATLVDGILSSVLAWILSILMNENASQSINNSLTQSPDEMALTLENLVSPSDSIANLLYAIIFVIIFTATQFRGSPGKLLCRIQVVNPDMTQIGIGKSIGRYFSYILSAIPLMIGFMLAGWTKDKKALHDMICNTRVVYRD